MKTEIKAVYNTNRGIYGYRRIAAFLRFILNTEVGDRLVWKLMNEMSLTSHMVRKSYKKPTTTNVWFT
ncbi:transposase [Leuconostoc lactis]|uniref:transposase n=1 Tax=Leuconostoc lactis TaxID=1246 RepID=UPI003A521444